MPPAEAPQRKKRTAAAAAKPVPDSDHRKRRRNRTTQSCLNCHTSKRMCDRKRPACARCTQLGLTGLCVYEVDDPNQRADVDEQGRLRQRVAELEGVIREMKNKPHPRWASDGAPGTEPERWFAHRTEDSFAHDVKPLASTSQSPILPFNAYPPSHAPDLVSSPSSSLSFFSSSSPLSTPSPIMTPSDEYSHPPYVVDQHHSDVPTDLDLTSMFMPYQNYDPGYGDLHMEPHVHSSPAKEHHHNQHPHCGCLMESNVYNTVLDLSMRVRKASETLNITQRHHHMGQNCNMVQRLSDFDMFTSNALAGIPTPTNEVVTPNAPPFTPPDRQSIALASAIAQTTKMAAPDMSGRSSHMPVSTISPQMLHAMRSQWESIPSGPEPTHCDEGYIPWDHSRRL